MTIRTALACGAAALAIVLPAQAQQTISEQWGAIEAQAKAEQAAYAALKARYDAEAAAAKAKAGPLADYATPGSVDAAAGAGKLETQILAAGAMRSVSDRIAARIVVATAPRDAVCGDPKASAQTKEPYRCNIRPSIIVGTEADKVNFDSYEAFLIQVAELDQALERALYIKPEPAAPGAKPQVATSSTIGVTGIATTLSVAGNLFRSDYKVAGVDLAATSDALLAKMVAGRAIRLLPGYDVMLTSLFIRPVATEAVNPARARLDTASAKRASLAAEAERNRQKASQGGPNAAGYTAVAAKMDAVIKRFDDFVAKLSTPDANGQVPFLAIARQAEITQRLKQGGLMVFVKVDYSGGTTYSKKNFFTFLGGMPFYASGGVLVSYMLIDGATGRTIDIGDGEDVTPFTSISKIGRRGDRPR